MAAQPWALFEETLEKCGRGDHAGAARAAAAFRKTGPRGAATALEGFLWAAKGKPQQALSLLYKAVRLSPREAWIYDWLAQTLEGAGEGPAARKALLDGVRVEAAPQRMLSLSRVCEKLGLNDEARTWAQKACRSSPSADAHAWLAHLYAHQRHFDDSAAEYAKAIKLSPEDSGLRLARSQSLALAGRLKEALAAAPVEPEGALGLWRGQLEGLLGKKLSAPTPFTRGYALLSSGKYAAAAKEFAKVSGSFERRGRFYRTVALMLDGAGPERAAGLSMIGLGVDPPYSATVQALRRLAGCDVVFNNIQGAEIAELLWPLCRDVRPAYSEAVDLTPLSKAVMTEIRAGKRVGFVTRGSALLFGRLGNSLAARCKAEKLPWECLAALSTADLFEARVGGFGRGAGVLAYESSLPSDAKLEGAVPWTVFAPEPCTPSKWKALRKDLVSRLGASRKVYYFDHKVGDAPIETTLGKLGGYEGRLSRAPILRIPASGEKRPSSRGPQLLLVGLGPYPRRHATIEALEALGRADCVVADGLSPSDRTWLSRFCRLSAKLAGERPAYVTPHHPFRYHVPASGFSFRALPAISAESAACAEHGVELGAGVTAVQAFDRRARELRREPRWPCLVYDVRGDDAVFL